MLGTNPDNWHLFLLVLFGLYGSISGMQMLLYTFLLNRGWRHILKAPSHVDNKIIAPWPNISILLCARNEAQNLNKYLPKLLQQQYPGIFELILVNDASTDATAQILASCSKDYPQLKVINLTVKTKPGKKVALTKGIESAKGEWILLTDADCAPASQLWLQSMAQSIMQAPHLEIVLGFGPMYPQKGLLNAWARFETNHTAFLYGGMAGIGMPYMGVGRNLAFKKTLFHAQEGYQKHAHFAAGDDDLLVNAAATAQNTGICTNAQANMFSLAATNWRDWFRQKRRHLSVSNMYKFEHQMLLTAFAGTQVMHYFLLFLNILAWQFALPALFLYCLRQWSLRFHYMRCFALMDSTDLFNKLPLLDIMLSLYYGLLVPYNLLFRPKSIPWK